MKKILIIFSVLLAYGCKQEAALEPSNYDKNMLVVHDSEDPIDHQIYEIYKSTGIPIFYNDSVTTEERLTPAGVKYMHTERLKIFYKPGAKPPTSNNNKFELVDFSVVKKDTLSIVLDYLQNTLLPKIPKSVHIPSILLVKTLRTSSDPSSPNGSLTSLYGGFNTIVIGKVISYTTMSAANKKIFENELLTLLVANNMSQRYKDWLDYEFYSQSERKGGHIVVYTPEEKPRGLALGFDYCDKFSPVLTPAPEIFYSLGFIGECDGENNIRTPKNMRLPRKSQDLTMFVNACFFMSDAEFKEKFKDYDVILEKYLVIRAKILDMGFILD